jgi:hypothetical protein
MGRCVLVVLAVVMAGCGPAAGMECTIPGTALCDGDSAVLWCESNRRLVRYGCPGGCLDGSGRVACMFQGSREGDSCPTVGADDVGFCASSTRFLRCEAGRFAGLACSSCTTSGLSATCQP